MHRHVGQDLRNAYAGALFSPNVTAFASCERNCKKKGQCIRKMIAIAHFDIANKNARLHKKLQTPQHHSWMNMKQYQGTDIAMLR